VDTGNHDFKALIFKFMVNGSLERWLHCEYSSGMPERVLSLGQRICIAADVASALGYIHNQVTPPLVHCDLKPSTILLDNDMTARLSDFGSAKFLFPGLINPKSLVEVGGTIGYMAPGEFTFLAYLRSCVPIVHLELEEINSPLQSTAWAPKSTQEEMCTVLECFFWRC